MKKRMLIFTVMAVLFFTFTTAQAGIVNTWTSESTFLAAECGPLNGKL